MIVGSYPCRCTGTIGIYQITPQAQWVCGACGGNGVGPREYFATPITVTIEAPGFSFASTIAEIDAMFSAAAKKARAVRQRPCKRHKVVACQAPCCR